LSPALEVDLPPLGATIQLAEVTALVTLLALR